MSGDATPAMDRETAGYSPWGSQRLAHDWMTNTFLDKEFMQHNGYIRSLEKSLNTFQQCEVVKEGEHKRHGKKISGH